MGETIHIIYHADWDGIVAAWVARNGLKRPGVSFEFHSINYGQAPPKIPLDRDVYILDFAFTPEAFKRFAAGRTGRIVMLDHHKTAIEQWQAAGFATESVGRDEFRGLRFHTGDSNQEVIFHDGEAGCSMTLVYLRGYYEPGQEWDGSVGVALVEYAADHDLWRFKRPHSREIRAAMRSYPQTLEACDELNEKMRNAHMSLVEEGRAVQRFMERQIESACRHAELMEIQGHRCWAAQVPFDGLISEVAGRLSEREDGEFGVCWFKAKGGEWIYSLRAKRDVAEFLDVSDVAKALGGGGHARAAGFSSQVSPIEFLVRGE